MWDSFWTDRGQPWDFDPGPPVGGHLNELFAVAWSGKEEFRWHFGPMFFRGRTQPGAARVLIIGQEGAQDESLGHRSFVGGTGGRMQHVLTHLGITHSYLFMNTFVYPIFGQYDAGLRPLAQDPRSPIVKHRHALFDEVIATQDIRLVIAVGTAAKESVATWVAAKGGHADPAKLHEANGSVLAPKVRLIGVLHPGGASKGGSVTAIVADFKTALGRIGAWIAADPAWLPADADGHRAAPDAYKYTASPIPFRDLSFGTPWRIGLKTTTSNRKDGQRAIQLFSHDGKYNNTGVALHYAGNLDGSNEGYLDESGDLPYEPPRHSFSGYDPGPSTAFAALLQGGDPAFPWPDFSALGLPGHPSFGFGPIYRGRLTTPSVLVLADQASSDDLFTGRALTGDGGQRLQAFLAAAGLTTRYAIVRCLPVDALTAPAATVQSAVDDTKVRAVHTEIMRRAQPKVVVAAGASATRLLANVAPAGTPVVTMKAWGTTGALADWRRALNELKAVTYPKDKTASFTYDGSRVQIPRIDLPFGTLRWQASSGDRAAQATIASHPSPDYFKIAMPKWAFVLTPTALSASEQAAVESLRA
jgi:uracil-DNA glycosylase